VKAALVTGGSGGIGLAIARMLASDGYALTIAARRPEPLQAAADALRTEFGVPVESVAGSLASDDAVRAAVDAHAAAYGRMDVLINNAGRGIVSPLESVKDSHLDLQLDLNLRSVIRCMQFSLPLLRAAVAADGIAQVVNMSSVVGKEGQRDLSIYSAAKHGVVGFTEAMNKELGHEHIRSTVLCPAEVDTPLTEYFRDVIPQDEMIQVSDVAEAVRCLLGLTRYCVVPEVVFLRAGGVWGA
jgi:NAD(P)-dependent dehydrogenase (short-subunit alcohol dehydrogenase family)